MRFKKLMFLLIEKALNYFSSRLILLVMKELKYVSKISLIPSSLVLRGLILYRRRIRVQAARMVLKFGSEGDHHLSPCLSSRRVDKFIKMMLLNLARDDTMRTD